MHFRATAAALALLAFLAAPSAQAADARGAKKITYTRAGGWRGMNQTLTITSLRTLDVTEDGVAKPPKQLKPAQSQKLRTLLHAATRTQVFDDKMKGKLADGFTVTLLLDGADKPVLSRDVLTTPPTGVGASWDPLLKELDATLEKEISKPKEAPKSASSKTKSSKGS